LRHSSPCYEIHEDDKKFQFSVEVPGVKPEDMTVQVEQDGRVLRLAGGRKIKRGDEVVETHFEKSFRLDIEVDPSKITANLAAKVADARHLRPILDNSGRADRHPRSIGESAVMCGPMQGELIAPVAARSNG
jgi:hypothetical protein